MHRAVHYKSTQWYTWFTVYTARAPHTAMYTCSVLWALNDVHGPKYTVYVHCALYSAYALYAERAVTVAQCTYTRHVQCTVLLGRTNELSAVNTQKGAQCIFSVRRQCTYIWNTWSVAVHENCIWLYNYIECSTAIVEWWQWWWWCKAPIATDAVHFA